MCKQQQVRYILCGHCSLVKYSYIFLYMHKNVHCVVYNFHSHAAMCVQAVLHGVGVYRWIVCVNIHVYTHVFHITGV